MRERRAKWTLKASVKKIARANRPRNGAIYSQSKAEIGSSPTPLAAEAYCFFASFRLASAFALSALSAA
jgi:hypothetical protein